MRPISSCTLLRASTLFATLVLTACGSSTTDPTPTGGGVATVELTPGAATLSSLGETTTLTATPRDAAGTPVAGAVVAWSSSAPLTASVTSQGLVTGLADGPATITASSGGQSATADITVSQVAAQLVFETEPSTTAVGDVIAPPIAVRLEDALGSVVAGSSVLVTISLGANPAGATLGGTTSVAASGGVAQFTDLTLDVAAADYTLSASAGQLPAATSRAFEISGPAVWTQVTVGGRHTCGLRTGGTAYCWGNDEDAQLGTGTGGPLTRPRAVQGGHVFTQISAGNVHTCGVTSNATAYCWGTNQDGALGIGTNVASTGQPTELAGGFSFSIVVAGMLRGACGITTGADAYCWGENVFGAVGDGTTTDRNSPTLVSGGLQWQSVARDLGHTCGVTVQGQGYCWGRNPQGGLGDGSLNSSLVPVEVNNGADLALLETGQEFSCGIRATAPDAVCWGANSNGQLGNGTQVDALTPTGVSGQMSFSDIDGGVFFTCGVTTSSVGYCWGVATQGELGIGQTTETFYNTPQAVAGSLAFESIAVGRHACGITTAGELYCWGLNEWGQLGDASQVSRDAPVRVLDPT